MIPAGASVPVSRTRAGTGRGERPKPHRTTWPGLPAVAGALSLLCHEIFLYPVYKVVFVKNKRLFFADIGNYQPERVTYSYDIGWMAEKNIRCRCKNTPIFTQLKYGDR